MADFHLWSPLLGGVCIGLAASMLLLFNGQIAGISGIFRRALSVIRSRDYWTVYFIVGLVLGGFVIQKFLSIEVEQLHRQVSLFVLAVAGLCVGFGTRLGNGCTSGHGVCGLARLSKRSLIATVSFMLAGVVTVYIMNHIVR